MWRTLPEPACRVRAETSFVRSATLDRLRHPCSERRARARPRARCRTDGYRYSTYDKTTTRSDRTTALPSDPPVVNDGGGEGDEKAEREEGEEVGQQGAAGKARASATVLTVSSQAKRLHLYASEGRVYKLRGHLSRGGKVDKLDDERWTLLHSACDGGQLEAAQFLLAHGAQLEARTALGYTPLMLAAREGWLMVANELLERGADKNASTEVRSHHFPRNRPRSRPT